MLNSHILYQKSGGKRTILQFEHDVIAEFLFPGAEPHVDKVEAVVRLTERHFPSVLQPTPSWTKPQARCRVCSKKGQRREPMTSRHSVPSVPVSRACVRHRVLDCGIPRIDIGSSVATVT